jgi:hypothetical protein
MKKGHGTWNMECKEPVKVRFTDNSSQGIGKI